MRKVLILLCLFLVACTTVPLEKQCQVDTDCVKAECCHASSVVASDYAPSCGGTFCTEECQPGTLDCGQGSIACVSGECRVVLS